MIKDSASLPATMKSLLALLDREAREIRKRNFGAVAELTEEKSALAERLDALGRRFFGEKRDEALYANLQSIIVKARENAEQLKLLQTGLANARRRIEAILEEAQSTGAYARGGDAIRQAAPSRIAREA